MEWFVYIIRASDNSLYTGITKNIQKRLEEHNGGVKGAKFFRGRSAERVLYREQGHTRSSAAKRELEIKKLTRREKLRLIDESTHPPSVK